MNIKAELRLEVRIRINICLNNRDSIESKSDTISIRVIYTSNLHVWNWLLLLIWLDSTGQLGLYREDLFNRWFISLYSYEYWVCMNKHKYAFYKCIDNTNILHRLSLPAWQQLAQEAKWTRFEITHLRTTVGHAGKALQTVRAFAVKSLWTVAVAVGGSVVPVASTTLLLISESKLEDADNEENKKKSSSHY